VGVDAGTRFAPDPFAGDAMSTPTVTPQHLKGHHESGRPIDLVDVRTPVEFRELHVEFARNVPLDQLDVSAVVRDRLGRPGEPLFVICQSGARGRLACERLRAAGCTDAVNVEGGTLACVDASLPVVRGKRAVSLERQVRIAAGLLVLLGLIIGWLVHPVGFGLTAFVGGGLVFAGVTDFCGMGLLLARMPWNRVAAPDVCQSR
jgi:rhodanese-related sulfurtransferase